ncbi:MAG: hypothetical protein ACSHW6_04500 [Sulfitobacter geojensis]
MAEIMSMRARRFQALYTLLMGADYPELPTPHQMPDALMKDVGLPERDRPFHITGPLGTFSTDPFKR